MSTRTGAGKASGRIRLIALSVAIATVLPIVLATSAMAVSLRTGGSYPGSATAPATVVYVDRFVFQGRRVYESPAYGAQWQYVCATYNLWRLSSLDGPLVTDSAHNCQWISPSQTALNVSSWSANTRCLNLCLSGPFRAQVFVTWQLSNGTYLGTRTYNYIYDRDYICQASSCYKQSYIDGGIWIYGQ